MTAGTIYQFKPQARLKGDPQQVGEAIEEIIVAKGAVGPREVVEAARPTSAVLHSYFTWDDTAAAEKYREQQAAHLMRSIVVVQSQDTKTALPMRAFVAVAGAAVIDDAAPEGAAPARYITLAEAKRVVSYREEMMRTAMRDLDAYRIRYQLLADLTGWATALNKARTMLEQAIEASQVTKRAPASKTPDSGIGAPSP